MEKMKIQKSGWEEEEIDYFLGCMENLLKAEVRFFQYVINIIYSYHLQILLGEGYDKSEEPFEHESVLEKDLSEFCLFEKI